jgi:hypothetical protein
MVWGQENGRAKLVIHHDQSKHQGVRTLLVPLAFIVNLSKPSLVISGPVVHISEFAFPWFVNVASSAKISSVVAVPTDKNVHDVENRPPSVPGVMTRNDT